jgi:hypothetical protein
MTERETDLLREFKEKLDKLINLHLRMKSEKQLLIEEQSKLNEEIRKLSLNNDELTREMEVLKVAKSMLEGDENSHEAKLKLNRIVREIDKCIAMLNK